MPSQVGQHGAFQVFILEKHRAPGVIFAAIAQVIPQSVGVVKAAVRKLIEWRIGIRSILFIGRQGQSALPHANLSPSRRNRKEE
jgi:hypothetical protein